MNRLLLEAGELKAGNKVELADFRARHLCEVLKVAVGDAVRVGILDGGIGTGTVTACEYHRGEVRLQVVLEGEAPEPWADLILALPRPKVLKRLWPQLAAIGLRRIVLLNAAKVERCYYGSHAIEPETYRPLLIEGLMQAGTTRLPEVRLCRRFKRFMREELDAVAGDDLRLLAHPGAATPIPPQLTAGARPLLAIGPEGGWTDLELEAFQKSGFERFSLGTRTLRTDTACMALLAVLGHAVVH